ncbi:endonuclease/exonuclease/phosphatase family protein [Mesorhizobium sp. KR9-304]|uniref:endonuclease/exonuclease/phosphatase family protein n=1 Tax=Mesorhizobium sp. KR9-304 TaxID=3156614 RepID=UPI0032B4DF5A
MTTASLTRSPPAMASKTSTGVTWLLVFAAALTTGLAAFADRSWPGDMIIFFRPQLALGVLLLLCAGIWLRRWLACVALGALLVVNGLPLFVTGAPTAAAAETPNLRILSANVLFDNPEPARFGEVVAALAPDIIVTQEAKFKWPGVLKALPGYPYLVGPNISKWNGNLVLSRYPLRARLVADMPPSGYALGGGYAVRVEVDLPGRAQPLVVYAVHAPTPRTFAGWQARNRYLDVVAERIAAEPEGTPVVLAGDWNTPVWSPAYGRTLLLSGLEATERSAWPPASRLFASFGGVDFGTPIDHIAISRGVEVADLFTGPDFGSDHLPVVVDLKLP